MFKTINQTRAPLFPHDCDQCTYIDTCDGQDLYICDNTEGDMLSVSFATCIARYGPEGHQYASLGVPELQGRTLFTLPYLGLMAFAWARYQQHMGVDLDTLNNPKRFYSETFKKEK